MERLEISPTIREMCAKVLLVPPDGVVPEARLIADLEADSLDIVELEDKLEDEFGIKPPDQWLRPAETVADVIALVEEHLAAKQAAELA
jgi:acyl carrier protein